MGRLPRIYEANRVYESTTRALQRRFRLLPGDEANDLIAGIYELPARHASQRPDSAAPGSLDLRVLK